MPQKKLMTKQMAILMMQEVPEEYPQLQIRELHPQALVANYQLRLLLQQERQEKDRRRQNKLHAWTFMQNNCEAASWNALFDRQTLTHKCIVEEESALRETILGAADVHKQEMLKKERELETELVIVSSLTPCDVTMQRTKKAATWNAYRNWLGF